MRRNRPDAERLEPGGSDPQQDTAAVVEIAADPVERSVGLRVAIKDPLLGQPAAEQRRDDFGCGAAAQRARQRSRLRRGAGKRPKE
jgi:hypothetical protein